VIRQDEATTALFVRLLCFMAKNDVREHHIPNKHNIDATQEKVKTNKPVKRDGNVR